MLLDKETLFADDAAFGDTPAVLDLESIRPGPGQPIKCFFVGSDDLAGVTGIDVLDGTTSSPANALMTVAGDPAGKTIEFHLPSDTQQFVTIALAGTASAGTFSAGIVMDVQTNQ